MHVRFPHQLMRQDARFRIAGQSQAPVQSVSGAFTIRPAMGAHWQASVTLVARGEAQQLALQAFIAGMEGQLGTTDVPLIARHRPMDRDGLPVNGCDIADLADAQTAEHFGFQNAPIVAATLAVSAALRATQIAVTYLDSVGLRPGHRFSINGRIYEVQLTWIEAGQNIVQFQPPLREAATSGDAVEIHHPRCIMRLASAEGPDYSEALIRQQAVTLSFIEAI